MTNSPSNHHVIPSEENQGCHSDVHEATVSGNDSDLFSTSEWTRIEASTKWTYFLLGCAILLPWNALINGTMFFLSRLANSPFHATFSSYLSTVYTLSNLVFQFYSTFTLKQSSSSRRIFASVTAAMLLVASLFFSTFTRGTPLAFYLFTLFNAASLAATSGYMYTAVYAGASRLGAPFLQTVISGQAAIAVGVSAVQVVSSAISVWGSSKSTSAKVMMTGGTDDQAEELAAQIFFGVSAVFLAVTLIAYAWLAKQPCYKSFIDTPEQHNGGTRDPDEFTRLVADDCRNPQVKPSSRVYHVCERNWSFMFSIAYVFAVTLAVYPAITVRVQPMNPGVHPMLFAAVHFLAFNTGDLAGRYTCSFPRLIVWSANKILVMSLLRTLFVPLILLCNVPRHMTSPVSPVIDSDFLFMVVLLTMGYTNGYVSTIATIAVSSLEHNPRLGGHRDDVDIAATLGGCFVIVGLAMGALCSFPIQTML